MPQVGLRHEAAGRLLDLVEPLLGVEADAATVAEHLAIGGGEHLAEQARLHPDTGYIGCEPFENGVAKLLTQVQAGRLHNVRVVPDDARDILVRLPDASLSNVFVLFPDPWPKLRHHKRRFIQTRTLDQIFRLLKPRGELRIATDHVDYGQWALMHLIRDTLRAESTPCRKKLHLPQIFSDIAGPFPAFELGIKAAAMYFDPSFPDKMSLFAG